MRGRWAQLEGDADSPGAAQCRFSGQTAGRLIEIDSDSIEFFETTAVLESVQERDETRVEARLSEKVGDSVSTRALSLDTQDGGATLVTRELDPDGDPGPTRYRRCPSSPT